MVVLGQDGRRRRARIRAACAVSPLPPAGRSSRAGVRARLWGPPGVRAPRGRVRVGLRAGGRLASDGGKLAGEARKCPGSHQPATPTVTARAPVRASSVGRRCRTPVRSTSVPASTTRTRQMPRWKCPASEAEPVQPALRLRATPRAIRLTPVTSDSAAHDHHHGRRHCSCCDSRHRGPQDTEPGRFRGCRLRRPTPGTPLGIVLRSIEQVRAGQLGMKDIPASHLKPFHTKSNDASAR